MNPKIFLVVFLMIWVTISSWAQDDLCGCSDYNSVANIDLYHDFFPPEIISNEGIRKAQLYYVGFDGDSLSSFPEKEFHFNSDGFIIKRIWFKYNGQIHYYYDFIRDSLHQLIEYRSFYHLINSRIDTIWNWQFTKFSYDELGRKVKEKDSEFLGGANYLADSLSHYKLYEYDKLDRIVKETSHYYNESDPNPSHRYVSNFKYFPDYKSNKTPQAPYDSLWKEETSYNEYWRPVKSTFWQISEDSTYKWQIEEYKYSKLNQITAYSRLSMKERIMECPQKGTFTEHYIYNKKQLLNEIIHEYDNIICRIKIIYE